MPDSRAQSATEALLTQAGWVRGLALSLVGRAADADDAAQATWLAALEKPPRLRASPRAWLRAVLRNVVARSSRRSDLRTQAEARRERRPDAEGAGDVIERAEVHRKLVDHVMALDEPGRSTILMHYFDGFSLAEIARRLGVPAGTVRARHHRAVEQLRARLESQRADWRAMLLPLAGLPGALPVATAGGRVAAEIIAMTLKAKVGIAAAAVILLAVATLVFSTRALFGPPAQPGSKAPVDGTPPQADGDDRLKPASPGAPHLSPKPFPDAEKIVLRGRVRRADDGPVENARVVVARYDLPEPLDADTADNAAGFPRVVIPDAAGDFRLELALAAPAFAVLATAKGCSPGSVTAWADRLGAPVEVVLEKGVVLSGTVQTLERVPVPGARVALRSFVGGVSVRREAKSDEEGRYRIEGLPGRSDWTVGPRLLETFADGFAPQKLTQLADPDMQGAIRQDVFMTRGATVRGVVVDAETGAPLPEARVVVWTINEVWKVRKPDGTWIENPDLVQPLADALARADGTFAFERMPSWGVHTFGWRHWRRGEALPSGGVAALAPGHAPMAVGLDLAAEGSTVEVVLRCKPAARIRGRVVDSESRPVAGARVSRSADPEEDEVGWLPRGLFSFAPSQEARSDESGAYVLEGVPSPTAAQPPFRVSAQGPGWPATGSAEVEVAVSGKRNIQAPDLVLALDWERTAIIHVLTEDGRPVWGAAILHGGHADVPIGRTDRDGRVRVQLDEKPTATTRLDVQAPGFALQPFEVTPSATAPAETTVTLHPGRTVSGTVVHPDGSPAAGAYVLISNLRLGAAFPGARATATGSFEFVDLEPGPYDLTASLSAGAGDDDERTHGSLSGVPEGPGVRIVLERPVAKLRAGLTVVCVEKATGKSVLRCNGTLVKDEMETWSHPTAPGEFAFPNVEPGEWKLRVDPRGFAPQERKVVLEAGKTLRVTVGLERGVTLKGRVRHPEGKPFRKPVLHLIGSRQDPLLDPDGSFEATGLLPGSRIGVVVDDTLNLETGLKSSLFVTPPRDFVTIPADKAEITADFPLVVAGMLTLQIEGDHLFTPGRTPTEAHRDLVRRSRVEIRDASGVPMLDETGITYSYGMTLPQGRCTVRLEVPGVGVYEQAADLTSGRADLRIEVK
jgi:RNA polymerase sigma factor (sigma-70 family)